jgi:hypothetical protein
MKQLRSTMLVLWNLKEKGSLGERNRRLPSFSFKPAGWQARSISGDTGQSSR